MAVVTWFANPKSLSRSTLDVSSLLTATSTSLSTGPNPPRELTHRAEQKRPPESSIAVSITKHVNAPAGYNFEVNATYDQRPLYPEGVNLRRC